MVDARCSLLACIYLGRVEVELISLPGLLLFITIVIHIHNNMNVEPMEHTPITLIQ
jgi:hypothetical protein